MSYNKLICIICGIAIRHHIFRWSIFFVRNYAGKTKRTINGTRCFWLCIYLYIINSGSLPQEIFKLIRTNIHFYFSSFPCIMVIRWLDHNSNRLNNISFTRLFSGYKNDRFCILYIDIIIQNYIGCYKTQIISSTWNRSAESSII